MDMDDDAEDVWVPTAQIVMFMRLFNLGTTDVPEMSLELGEHPQRVEAGLAELQSAGLAECHADDTTGVVLWRLTAQGRRAYAIMRYRSERARAEWRQNNPRDPMVPERRSRFRRWWDGSLS